MAKETTPRKLELTDWGRKNFRFIGELQSLGFHNEAHYLKYNPVSADDLKEFSHSKNPGLAKLIVDRPKANQGSSSKSKNGNPPSHEEQSPETPLVTHTAV